MKTDERQGKTMDLTGSYGDAPCKHEGGFNSTINSFFLG